MFKCAKEQNIFGYRSVGVPVLPVEKVGPEMDQLCDKSRREEQMATSGMQRNIITPHLDWSMSVAQRELHLE